MRSRTLLTRADVPERVPTRLFGEEAAQARSGRLGRREASKQAAEERAIERVGARPIRITSQLGLVAQRRLRDRGWTAARAEADSPAR